LAEGETSTLLARVHANGDYTATSPIIGGTVTISGDHNDYSMTMDIVLADDTTLAASYNGPFMIEAPEPEVIPFGDIVEADYGAMDWGGPVNYALRLTEENKVNDGTGYILALDLYGTPSSNPAAIIPDGTYTLGGTDAWQIDPAYSELRSYDKNIAGPKEKLASATLTSTHNGSYTYTMVIDVVSESGLEIKQTYTGLVTLAWDMTSASAKPQKATVKSSGKSFLKPAGNSLSDLRNL
jgi:hypothetical protein